MKFTFNGKEVSFIKSDQAGWLYIGFAWVFIIGLILIAAATHS